MQIVNNHNNNNQCSTNKPYQFGGKNNLYMIYIVLENHVHVVVKITIHQRIVDVNVILIHHNNQI